MTRRLFFAFFLAAFAISGAAQDALKAFPKNYWLEFEDPTFKVIHVRYRAHEKVGVHDHPSTPTLFVYISDSGPVAFEHAGKDTFDLNRAPLKRGQMRVSPGRLETHHIENLGDIDSDFLRVEFKTLPLGLKDFEKRIPAASEAFWQQPEPEQEEFDSPHMRVTRLGVQAGQHRVLQAVPGVRTLWIEIAADGATIAGKPVHAGESWDSRTLDVTAGSTRAEMVRVDIKP